MNDSDPSQLLTAVINGDVLSPDGIIPQAHLLIEGNTILHLDPDPLDPPPSTRVLDAGGHYIIPGLIDIHTHGLMGFDNFGPGLADAIQAYPANGVTSFLATTMTAPVEKTVEKLKQMAAILENPPAGARCLGIHLEGPHLAADQAGIANPEWFRDFNWNEYQRWQNAAGGWIKRITLAPERLSDYNLIHQLDQEGVKVSAGHTDASYQSMSQAIAAGVQASTHTFNAMRGFHHRRPGALGALLTADDVYAEVIGDGHHLHPASFEILLRLKGAERVTLVSDSAPLAGLPDGTYEWLGQSIQVIEGQCRTASGQLAGSHTGLDGGIRWLIEALNLPMEKAIPLAAANPARAIGRPDLGTLAPGMKADLCWLTQDLIPALTMIDGRVRWRSAATGPQDEKPDG